MENNLDINLIVQSFQDRVNALTLEAVIKDATIRQLTEQLNNATNPNTIEKTHQFKPKDKI